MVSVVDKQVWPLVVQADTDPVVSVALLTACWTRFFVRLEKSSALPQKSEYLAAEPGWIVMLERQHSVRAHGSRRTRRVGIGAAVAAALVASACGGGGSGAVSDGASEAAAANIETLEASTDVRDFEILSVNDGSKTTLRDAIDGDRPVLVWFWAPH